MKGHAATTQTAYGELESKFKRLNTLREAVNVLHWDMATMMPEGGAGARAEQLATLRVVCHEVLSDPTLPALLDRAALEADRLDPWQAANLREMRREQVHATALPSDLVSALSRAGSECEMVWRTARPAADFAMVLPSLEKLLALVKEKAAAKADRLGVSRYEALLDEWEPDGRTADIDRLFVPLARELPGLIEGALERQTRAPAAVAPTGPFAIETQRAASVRLMEHLGFDFEHGRLDVSLHPFCGGTPDDVRITTRYDESDFTTALMGVLHETGHALYERGLPEQWRGQPVGAPRGMSVHESQSLLVEMQVCRSRAFLEFAAPILRDFFGGEGPAWDADNLCRLNTRVDRSFIRVDADEVTYPAHVILRYRLERALVEGDLALRDMPGAWNDGMRELLGVAPPDDRLGCLQDVHWYDGAWGYFPTYTLGAMTAAQLFAAARRATPGLEAGIARGEFAPLFAWLRENVHGKGSLLSTSELIAAATGAPLDADVFLDHLRSRYFGVR